MDDMSTIDSVQMVRYEDNGAVDHNRSGAWKQFVDVRCMDGIGQ